MANEHKQNNLLQKKGVFINDFFKTHEEMLKSIHSK